MKQVYLILLSFFCFIKLISAQTIDANLIELNFNGDSDPQNFVSFQNGFYFSATDSSGRELWYSDGTEEGTTKVKDINPTSSNTSNSDPGSLIVVGNTLYFTAYDGIHGHELWKSDGTNNGTVMIKDIHPNNNSNYSISITNLTALNGILFFSATDGINGLELWKSDGTEEGTIMVKDINLSGNSTPTDLFVFNNSLYFSANDGINGTELWKSDGTEEGTSMVKNINPNYSGLTSGNKFMSLNGYFYFFANDGVNGYELWKSDGTEVGTTLVKNIGIGASSSSSVLNGGLLNGEMIFRANDGFMGPELWKSDGTEEGTTMIKDINSSSGSILYNSPFITYNNEIYFIADDSEHGNEIWKSDGTLNGTSMLMDINSGTSSVWIDKFHVDSINNKLFFFTTSTNSYDRTLWVSDGSDNGTFELSTITDSNTSGLVENFVTINNYTILTGENDIYGNELWITDGTVEGTSIFADLSHSNHSNPSKFVDLNGDLIFRAGGGQEDGDQLYKSDGTVAGTQMVKDINPGYGFMDDLTDIKEINGVIYFSAVDGTHGYELWRSDGTESGTYMVKDIRPNSQSGMIDEQKLTVLNNTLYFNADDGINGFELWRSDGTESGTYMVKNINASSNYNYSSYAREFVMLNNTIYFIANDNEGSGLWTTDGTESGTSKIISLNDMRVLKAVNNKLIIVAETSGTTYGPHDVWVSDGTASGTNHLQSFGDGLYSDIRITEIFNNELYFVAKNLNTTKKALYKTDGTLSGTLLEFDGSLFSTFPTIDIKNLLVCGDYLYFGVKDDYGFGADKELWRTNGAITEKVAESNTIDFLSIRSLTCYENNLLYLAEFFPHKIWIINDNLNEPLQLNVNIVNGPNFENYDAIEELASTSNNLYFRGRNDLSGLELYVTDIDASTLSISDYNALENSNSEIVRFYPNPAKDQFSIQLKEGLHLKKVNIYNNLGQLIQTTIKDNVEIVNFTTGLYFVEIITDKGKTTKQLVIE